MSVNVTAQQTQQLQHKQDLQASQQNSAATHLGRDVDVVGGIDLDNDEDGILHESLEQLHWWVRRGKC